MNLTAPTPQRPVRPMPAWLALLTLSALTSAASAQNVFVAVDQGTTRRIKVVRSGVPWSESGGKLVSEDRNRFNLGKATVYRPGFVALDDLQVSTSHVEDTSGNSFNYTMQIRGHARSETALKHCFMVLDMSFWKSNGFVFAELPDLPAGKQVDFDLTFRLVDRLEEGTYYVHVFSDGIESLHSKMSPAYVAAQRKKTEELLVARRRDYPAILARSEKAAYPAALKSERLSGTARIRCRVTTLGDVIAPEIVSTTHPAFGASALAAIRKWKFDPALKDLKLVESTLEVPFEFAP